MIVAAATSLLSSAAVIAAVITGVFGLVTIAINAFLTWRAWRRQVVASSRQIWVARFDRAITELNSADEYKQANAVLLLESAARPDEDGVESTAEERARALALVRRYRAHL